MPKFEERPALQAETPESTEQEVQPDSSAQEEDPKGQILELMTPDGPKKCEIVGQNDPVEGQEFGTVIVQDPDTGKLIPFDAAFIAEQLQAQQTAPVQTEGKSDRLGVGQWDLQTGEDLMNRPPSAEQRISDEESAKVRAQEAQAQAVRNQEILSQPTETTIERPVQFIDMKAVQAEVAAKEVEQTEPEQPQEQPRRMGVGRWDLKTGENLMNKEPTAEESAAYAQAEADRKKEEEARVARNKEVLSHAPENKAAKPVQFIDMEKVRAEMAAKAEAERANAEEEPELVPFTSRDVSKYKAGDRFVKPAFGGEPAFSGTIRRISGMDSKIWVEPDDNEQKLAA